MNVCRRIPEIRDAVSSARGAGKTIGLVPTMGALHEGHFSLIRASTGQTDLTVVSIFVNPAQFGQGEDLQAYPRPEEQDLAACRDLGAAAVFLPSVDEMYPRRPETRVEVPALAGHLCGQSRPGHFGGVCLVVAKLFNIVGPDIAFFGRKDYQQVTIIRRMCEDLNFPVEIRTCPTIREEDGLARSSRNAYLTDRERSQAPGLYRALQETADRIRSDHPSGAEAQAFLAERIARYVPDGQIDYASVSSPQTLAEVDTTQGPVVLALAVRLGRARLIDNLLVD